MLIPDTSHRLSIPELMDAPGLEPQRHARALDALARVNRLSWATGRVWRALRRLAGDHDRPLRVLDVACGGGDIVVGLARTARRAGMAIEVEGCDVSGFAVEQARRRASDAGVDATFFRCDAVRDTLPRGYDLVTSSLFLHHLSEEDAVAHLRSAASAGRCVVVQDLVRSRLGYAMAYLTLRLVSRSDVARIDGPRSVRGAFTVDEVRRLRDRAGLREARVEPCWPQRFVLTWSAP